MAALSFLFFHIGRQIKDMLGFSYTSTGIVAFFAFTFLINIILGLHGLSTARMEVMILYILTIILLLLRILYLKGISSRLLLLGGIAIAGVILYLLPASAFPENIFFTNSQQHGLHDIANFWYPSSADYFEKGLAYAMDQQRNGLPGYGLFTQHIVITVKRFLIFNPNALPTYYFAHYTSFILVLFAIIELAITRKTKILILSLFCIHIFSQVWLLKLFFGCLMTDGIAALLLGIMAREVFVRQGQNFLQKNMILSFIQDLFLWCVVGTLYLTKPTIQYFALLLPFFMLRKDYFQHKVKFLVTMLACITILLVPLLWKKLEFQLGIDTDFHANYFNHFKGIFSQSFTIEFHPVKGIIKHWLIDKLSLFIALISLPCFFLGWSKEHQKEIIGSLTMAILNCAVIWGLYATLWVGFITYYDDAYRYFAQSYYVLLFAVAIAFNTIIVKKNREACP